MCAARNRTGDLNFVVIRGGGPLGPRPFVATRPLSVKIMAPRLCSPWIVRRASQGCCTAVARLGRANMGGDEVVEVLTAVKDSSVNPDVCATSALGAIALQLARRTSTDFGCFAFCKKLVADIFLILFAARGGG